MKRKSRNSITKLEKRILEQIYKYRFLTNKLLALILFNHLDSCIDTKKTYVSKAIKRLREEEGLISSKSSDNDSKEDIHLLTKKGVDFVKGYIKVDQQDPTAGFGGVYGDFTAKRLSDIKKTIKHHLMFVEYAIRKERDGYFVRHNLYCPQNYENNKLLPDGELQLVNGEIISVEVDTGSMRLSQLVGKFENYKNFFDHCIKNNQPIPWIAITFVTSQDDVPLEKNANFKRILSAASMGLEHYCWEVDILVGEYRLMQLLQNNQELLLNNNIPIPSRATSMEIDKVETYKESNEAIQQPVVEKTETSWEEKRQKYVQAEEERIRKELYKEAHKKWYELPEKNRTIVKGAHFGFIGGERVENTEKKKRLINEYFDSNIDARIKKIKVPLLFFDD